MTPPRLTNASEIDLAPRGAIPNWQPATTADDYVRNVREGLEEWSERRMAILMGWSRIRVYRAKMYAAIPKELFEKLITSREFRRHIVGSRALTAIGEHFAGKSPSTETERCPHCGKTTRIRLPINEKALAIVNAWLAESGAP
jgi:hypothetical protein